MIIIITYYILLHHYTIIMNRSLTIIERQLATKEFICCVRCHNNRVQKASFIFTFPVFPGRHQSWTVLSWWKMDKGVTNWQKWKQVLKSNEFLATFWLIWCWLIYLTDQCWWHHKFVPSQSVIQIVREIWKRAKCFDIAIRLKLALEDMESTSPSDSQFSLAQSHLMELWQ